MTDPPQSRSSEVISSKYISTMNTLILIDKQHQQTLQHQIVTAAGLSRLDPITSLSPRQRPCTLRRRIQMGPHNCTVGPAQMSFTPTHSLVTLYCCVDREVGCCVYCLLICGNRAHSHSVAHSVFLFDDGDKERPVVLSSRSKVMADVAICHGIVCDVGNGGPIWLYPPPESTIALA